MSVLEIFDACNDHQIRKILGGKTIQIQYKEDSPKKGIVTNFLSAVADTADRSIVGIILDEVDEIVISKDIIQSIDILN